MGLMRKIEEGVEKLKHEGALPSDFEIKGYEEGLVWGQSESVIVIWKDGLAYAADPTERETIFLYFDEEDDGAKLGHGYDFAPAPAYIINANID